jgi:hypothetical protein
MLLSGDANHARETALGELERVRAGYEEERKRREKELRERHQVAVCVCVYVCMYVCVCERGTR